MVEQTGHAMAESLFGVAQTVSTDVTSDFKLCCELSQTSLRACHQRVTQIIMLSLQVY
jgi:hypothetical protein